MSGISIKKQKVTIIIPCWNAEPYIASMLNCLIEQSVEDWHAFVIDDGSTDNSAKIIQSYEKKDSRISYHLRNREPKGPATCRNIGLQMSKGAEYVIFFDADDIVAPFCLSQRIRFMETNPNIDVASFPTKAFYSNIYDNTYWGFGRKFFDNTLEALLLWQTLPICTVTNIYRIDSLIKNGIAWDEHLLSMDDANFNIQVLAKGLNHQFDPNSKYDYFYRQTNNSLSKKIKTKAHYDGHVYYINRTLELIEEQEISPIAIKAFIFNLFLLLQDEKRIINRLFQVHWNRKHPIFSLKLLLFSILKQRGKKYLFPKENQFISKRIAGWSNFISNDIKQYVSKLN